MRADEETKQKEEENVEILEEDEDGYTRKHQDEIKITEEAKEINGFDESLENLMTIDESDEAGMSMASNAEGGEAKEDEENNTIDEAQMSVKKVIRILRLMQLFSEGHYTPLQNHCREQTDADG